jgi:hypothetical protein
MSLAAGMTVVVQPNVTTTDGRAGVQTGELGLVTADGYERLHDAPAGPILVGASTRTGAVTPDADPTTAQAHPTTAHANHSAAGVDEIMP